MARLPSYLRDELTPGPAKATRRPPTSSGLGCFLTSVRTRLISGLIFSLPIVITSWIIYWIFITIERLLLHADRRDGQSDSGLDAG